MYFSRIQFLNARVPIAGEPNSVAGIITSSRAVQLAKVLFPIVKLFVAFIETFFRLKQLSKDLPDVPLLPAVFISIFNSSIHWQLKKALATISVTPPRIFTLYLIVVLLKRPKMPVSLDVTAVLIVVPTSVATGMPVVP